MGTVECAFVIFSEASASLTQIHDGYRFKCRVTDRCAANSSCRKAGRLSVSSSFSYYACKTREHGLQGELVGGEDRIDAELRQYIGNGFVANFGDPKYENAKEDLDPHLLGNWHMYTLEIAEVFSLLIPFLLYQRWRLVSTFNGVNFAWN